MERNPVPTKAKPDGELIVRYDPAFPLADLHPFHKNPRRGDIPTIRESLKANGQYRPLVVNLGSKTDRPNEILAGNHTYAAAKAEGWKTIAVTFVDVDDEHSKRIVLVDNRASDKATNDADVLKDVLVSIEDLAGTGYTDEDLAKLVAGEGDPDTDPQLGEGYSVIIDCDDEDQQAELLAEFEDRGLSCRPLMM